MKKAYTLEIYLFYYNLCIENSANMLRACLLLLSFLFLLTACNRYNPEQDNIPDIPRPEQAYSNEAMRLAIRMVEQYPDEPLYQYKKGLLHLKRQEWREATELFNKALAYDSLNTTYRFALAKAYHAQEEYKKALQTLQRVLPKLDDSYEALLLAGELFYTQKEYDNATKNLNKALKITPYEAEVYYWKGTVALARLDTANAIRNLNLALARKPQYALAYNAFAEMYNRYELPDMAIFYANKGLQYQKQIPILYFTKAEAFRMKRFFEDSAKANYDQAYRLNRKLYMAAFYLGKYAYEAGKYDEAKRYLDAVVRQEPTIAYAHYYLGMCLYISGNKAEALKKMGLAMQHDNRLIAANDMYWAINRELQQERYYRYEDSIRRLQQRVDTTARF